MSYASINDPRFSTTVKTWLSNQAEILALIRYSHAAGNREFRLFTSFDDFSEALRPLPPLTCVSVFRQPQVPIRGVVDSAFIAKCLQNIPDGAEYLIIETIPRVYGRRSWFHYGSGESHAALREDLEECQAVPVVVGIYPAWLHDTDNVVSAVVPDEHGVARSGIY